MTTMIASISPILITLIVILGIAALVIFWGIAQYNKLVNSKGRYKNAFSQIDVQLKRRYDLIPNLVETAKAYLSHEKETLEAVIAARNTAQSAREGVSLDDSGSMQNLMQAEGGLGASLGRLMMVSEAYPDLKADKNMSELSEELKHTENKVSFSRQAYNDSATAHNILCEEFPTSIISGMFRFNQATLFEDITEEQREAVQVQF